VEASVGAAAVEAPVGAAAEEAGMLQSSQRAFYLISCLSRKGHTSRDCPPRGGGGQEELSTLGCFVGNIPFAMIESDLEQLFVGIGIQSAMVARDKKGRSKGYAFIEFATEEGQTAAVNLNVEVEGRVLKVRRSKGRKAKPPTAAAPSPEDLAMELGEAAPVAPVNLAWNPPAQQQQQEVAAGGVPKPQQTKAPLTASMLDAAPPQEQKQMLGERLVPLIKLMFPDLAGKITGVLLYMDNRELLHMLEDQKSLKVKVC
jgi:hypothetical protein